MQYEAIAANFPAIAVDEKYWWVQVLGSRCFPKALSWQARAPLHRDLSRRRLQIRRPQIQLTYRLRYFAGRENSD
jgi:hypothetical protein